jgi:hypothetical protein
MNRTIAPSESPAPSLPVSGTVSGPVLKRVATLTKERDVNVEMVIRCSEVLIPLDNIATYCTVSQRLAGAIDVILPPCQVLRGLARSAAKRTAQKWHKE